MIKSTRAVIRCPVASVSGSSSCSNLNLNRTRARIGGLVVRVGLLPAARLARPAARSGVQAARSRVQTGDLAGESAPDQARAGRARAGG